MDGSEVFEDFAAFLGRPEVPWAMQSLRLLYAKEGRNVWV
jgi:hypothetical protein